MNLHARLGAAPNETTGIERVERPTP